MLEQLELRRLLAVTAYDYGGNLYIEGDNANNWISVERDAGLIWVNLYGSGAGVNIFHGDEAQIWEIHLHGGGGNDILTIAQDVSEPATIWGGAGADYLLGGGGMYSDLYGHGVGSSGSGHSEASDDGAADTLVSGSGDSYLHGQDGNDHLYTDNYGTSGPDFMFGEDGHDTFYIRGHDGNAYANGQAGHDRLVPYQSATQHVDFEGNGGTDHVDYSDWTAAVYVTPNGLNDSGLRYGTRRQTIGSDVEVIYGTDYADHFSGTNSANWFYANAGNDLVYGYGGNDYLLGFDGNDTIYAGGGADFVHGGSGGDTLWGEHGNDTVYGSSGNDQIRGGADNDQLYGEGGSDWIYGEAESDLIVGGAGADYLESHDGGPGNDLVYGGNLDGTGNDGLDVAWIDRIYLNGTFIGDIIIGVESVAW
jgi:Ca2+-binding RTX toxin-like protein